MGIAGQVKRLAFASPRIMDLPALDQVELRFDRHTEETRYPCFFSDILLLPCATEEEGSGSDGREERQGRRHRDRLGLVVNGERRPSHVCCLVAIIPKLKLARTDCTICYEIIVFDTYIPTPIKLDREGGKVGQATGRQVEDPAGERPPAFPR